MNVPRLQWLAAKPAAKRTAEETEELFPLWLAEVDAPYRRSLARTRNALKDEETEIRMRGTVAYVMKERTNAPEAYVLFRGAIRPAPRARDAGHPGRVAADAGGRAAQPAGFCAMAVARRKIR